jgi:hypothetical protein
MLSGMEIDVAGQARAELIHEGRLLELVAL